MTLKPLGDRVVVKPLDDDEQTTPSGLVIPETAKEKPQTGEIVAVGPGGRDEDGDRTPMDGSVGDIVLYSKYGATEETHEGVEYLVVSERDLLAIVG